MKSRIAILITAAMMAAALAFTGCAKKGDDGVQQDTTAVGASGTADSYGQDGAADTNAPAENNAPAESAPAPAANSGAAGLALPQLDQPQSGETIAVVETNMGEFRMRFFPEYAPKAVENFVTHAKDGYYDGVIFHRVMLGFMIQGGDPEGTGRGGESIWGQGFDVEADPHLRHFRGAVSMANAGPGTNGSQFFVVQNDKMDADSAAQLKDLLNRQDEVLGQDAEGNDVLLSAFYPPELINEYLTNGGSDFLDGSYSVFGQVYQGMDVVDAIAGTPVDKSDPNSPKPLEDVVINHITITTY